MAEQVLQAMEESAPFPIMERRIGGKGGGSSQLTDEIMALMKQFKKLRQQVNTEADRRFDECFLESKN